MNKTSTILAMSLLLVPILAGVGITGYKAYGLSNGPSFGGGFYHYADGLVINGKTFDVSGYSQKIPTQNLTIGVPSDITVKIFDNDGSYTIRTATISLETPNRYSSLPGTETLIQYDLSGRTIVQDPHHFVESAKGSVSYSGKVAYVTFAITPRSVMGPSDMILSSTDSKLAVGYSLVTDAVAFANNTSSDHTNVGYIHTHCTATSKCESVCGDHVCKPGERPPSKP